MADYTGLSIGIGDQAGQEAHVSSEAIAANYERVAGARMTFGVAPGLHAKMS